MFILAQEEFEGLDDCGWFEDFPLGDALPTKAELALAFTGLNHQEKALRYVEHGGTAERWTEFWEDIVDRVTESAHARLCEMWKERSFIP